MVSQAADFRENWDRSVDYWEVFSANHAEDADVTVYQELHARFGTPSVEYGVGLGRVATKLRPTFGVDFSAAMIDRARKNAELTETELLLGDMCTMALPERVRFSYVAFSHFNAFTDDDYLLQAFENIRKNSRDDGHFVFDMRTPERYQRLDESVGKRFLGHSGDGWNFWVTVDRLELGIYSVTCDYERLDTSGDVLEATTVGPFVERSYSEHEISRLLTKASWEPVAPAVVTAANPYANSVTDQLWVARAVG